MLKDPNVERYVNQAVRPLRNKISKLEKEVIELKKQLQEKVGKEKYTDPWEGNTKKWNVLPLTVGENVIPLSVGENVIPLTVGITSNINDERRYDGEIDVEDHVMTADDWEQEVEYGSFINEDGSGYWVKNGKRSHDEVFGTPRLDATHVVWFNK
jgi:hypothetical protein